MPRINHPQIATVDISKTSKKGNGLGVYSTESGTIRTVEVPFAIPGDIVKAQLLRKASGVYSGRLEEIITPSADRITPRCLHFGVCGGCRWQQVPYEMQLEWKESHVRAQLAPYLDEQTHFFPIIACDPPWHYRNKMEFSFSSNAAGDHFWD